MLDNVAKMEKLKFIPPHHFCILLITNFTGKSNFLSLSAVSFADVEWQRTR